MPKCEGLRDKLSEVLRLDDEEAQEGLSAKEVRMRKNANFGYRFLIIGSSFLTFCYLGMLLGAIVLAAGGDRLSNLAFAAAPAWTVAILFIVLVAGLVKSPISVLITINRSTTKSTYMLAFNTVLVALELTILLVGVLRGNALSLVDAEVDLGQLAPGVEENIVGFALNNPVVWKEIQDIDLLECCGLNIRACYENEFSFANYDQSVVLNGRSCFAGQSSIDSTLAFFPTYNLDAEADADQDAIIGGDGFFCNARIANSIRSTAIQNAPWLSLPLVVELFQLFYLAKQLFRYTIKYGGMKANYDKYNGPVPKAEKTILAQAGYRRSPRVDF